MNIAILGFGTVGSGIYEILKNNAAEIEKRMGEEVKVKHILDIRDFSGHEDAELFTNDYSVILNDSSVSVVAEVIGGIEPSLSFTKSALAAGKSVVTSNKELVATHGTELMELARENGVSYLFEAAVGGGIPLIRPLYRCLAANSIEKIMGILNGTTNYILTKMIEEGQSFDEALSLAQSKGYAERNPAADVEGTDACRKIAILASLALGTYVDCKKISTEGISGIDAADVKYADALGADIKLIGYAEIRGGRAYARVSPMLIERDNPLACAKGVFNAVLLRGDSVGDVMFYGRGAGKLPTASAVLGDVLDICRNKNAAMSWGEEVCGSFMEDSAIKTGAFVRIKDDAKADFIKLYPDAREINAGIDGESGFVIASVSEEELKNINAEKIIRTEENFMSLPA